MTLEELLNKLIEKGFVPFNIPGITELKYYKTKQRLRITSLQNNIEYHDDFSLRDICSSESGLWQFVCENRKYGYTIPECWIKNPKICDEGIESVEKECNQNSYEYYIIESALRDESELEEFLLNSIIIDD